MDETAKPTTPRRLAQTGTQRRYHALYFDLDGTLLDPQSQIAPATLRLLDRLKEDGVRVGIATGRMFQSAEPYVRTIGCNAPLILFNGARISHPDNDTAYVQHKIDRLCARLVLKACAQWGIHVNLYQENRYFMDSDDPHGQAFIAKEHFMPVMVADLLDLLKRDPVKLLLIDEPEVLAQVHPELEHLVGDRATLVYSEPEFLEVLPPGVNKGRALRDAAHLMGLSARDIVAFGDGPNDADMIETAGLGVAMANARGRTMEVADMHTGSNADRGVASALTKIFPWLDDQPHRTRSRFGKADRCNEEEPT